MPSPKGIRRGTQASLAAFYNQLDERQFLKELGAQAAPALNRLLEMFTRNGEPLSRGEALAAWVASAGDVRKVCAVLGC